jgi:DNA-binding MarR family transcriptional regulator
VDKDNVDAILGQWQQVRPDLDCSPMGIIGRMSRASRLLERELKELFAQYSLESWEFDVLATLLRSGPPHVLTAGQLSTAAMVSSAALTNRIDHLVSKNLVAREVDQDNRRRVLISLTPQGMELVNKVVSQHVANEQRLLGGLTGTQQDQLARLLRRLLVSLGDC